MYRLLSFVWCLAATCLCAVAQAKDLEGQSEAAQSAHAFTFEMPYGEPIALKDYAGKAILIVNTATECGFSGQLAGLQKLHETYSDRGLLVLGVSVQRFRWPGTACRRRHRKVLRSQVRCRISTCRQDGRERRKGPSFLSMGRKRAWPHGTSLLELPQVSRRARRQHPCLVPDACAADFIGRDRRDREGPARILIPGSDLQHLFKRSEQLVNEACRPSCGRLPFRRRVFPRRTPRSFLLLIISHSAAWLLVCLSVCLSGCLSGWLAGNCNFDIAWPRGLR